jgi:hypothetical protein
MFVSLIVVSHGATVSRVTERVTGFACALTR